MRPCRPVRWSSISPVMMLKINNLIIWSYWHSLYILSRTTKVIQCLNDFISTRGEVLDLEMTLYETWNSHFCSTYLVSALCQANAREKLSSAWLRWEILCIVETALHCGGSLWGLSKVLLEGWRNHPTQPARVLGKAFLRGWGQKGLRWEEKYSKQTKQYVGKLGGKGWGAADTVQSLGNLSHCGMETRGGK